MLHAVSPPAIVYLQAEDSSFQPILPQEDTAQMYQRILDMEIAVPGGHQAQSNSNGGASKAGSSAQNLKLAAAMGLTQLMLPFRSVSTLSSTFCILHTHNTIWARCCWLAHATPPPLPRPSPRLPSHTPCFSQQLLASPVQHRRGAAGWHMGMLWAFGVGVLGVCKILTASSIFAGLRVS